MRLPVGTVLSQARLEGNLYHKFSDQSCSLLQVWPTEFSAANTIVIHDVVQRLLIGHQSRTVSGHIAKERCRPFRQDILPVVKKICLKSLYEFIRWNGRLEQMRLQPSNKGQRTFRDSYPKAAKLLRRHLWSSGRYSVTPAFFGLSTGVPSGVADFRPRHVPTGVGPLSRSRIAPAIALCRPDLPVCAWMRRDSERRPQSGRGRLWTAIRPPIHPPVHPPIHPPTVPTPFGCLSTSLGPAVSALCARLVSALCALCFALCLVTSDIAAGNLGDAACISRNTFKRPLEAELLYTPRLGASSCSWLLILGSCMVGEIESTVIRVLHSCTQPQRDGYR